MATRASWILRRHSKLPSIERTNKPSPCSVFASTVNEVDNGASARTTKAVTSQNNENETRARSVLAQSKLKNSQANAESWIMKQAEIEETLQIAADTVFGAMSLDSHKKDVKDYINKVCSLPEETKTEIWQKAQYKQHSGIKLCGKLISARDIPAMDANGKSDPYCLVGIISENDKDSEKVKTGNIMGWVKEGRVANVFRSTIKPATLEPVWNEELELPIRNLAGDIVVIEVWDSDEETVSVADIKGVKGFGQFLKDLKQKDDYIGRTFLSLKDIPPQGAPLTLELYSHTARHQRGIIAVHLSIKGQEEGKISLATKLDRYMLLFKAIVMHEAKQDNQVYQSNWDAEISDVAKELLASHATYYGIDDLQTAAIHLSVLFDYHKVYGVKPHPLVFLLDRIVEAEKSLSTAASSSGLSGTPRDWADHLLSVLQGLLADVDNILHTHLILMDMTTTSGVESLTWWIQIMMKLYQLDDLVARLPADRRSLKSALEASIQTSVRKWYMMSLENASLDSNGSTSSKLKATSESCLILCETIQKSIQPAVKKLANVDYLVCFFVSLDKLLSPAVMEFLKKWDDKQEDVANTLYEIYLNIKSLCVIACKLFEGTGTELQLLSYQQWFKKMVQVWLRVALIRCKERIDKAVQMDQIVSITNEVGYSSSLVDTSTFLYQVVEFWNNLDWSSPEETYTFMMELINYITEAASYYVDQIYKRVCNRSLVDKDTGKFNVTTQLCIILNNMGYMEQKLSSQKSQNVPSLVEELELQSSFEWLQKESGIGDQAKKLVGEIVDSAANDIEHKITGVSKQLGEQFIPTITKYIDEIVYATEGAKTVDVLSPLEDYLNTNLKTLSSNLVLSVFTNLLEHIWMATVDALGKSVSTIPKKPSQQYLYQRLHDALLFLNGFFNAGGEGLTGEHLDTEQYKTLLDQLELMCLSTRNLVLRCCADLAEQQAKAVGSPEHKLGELTLSVGYLKEAGNIEVTIFQGRNLPGLDKSGLSDPYVELALLPEFHFQKSSKKTKTPVQHKTLNPTFNHEFVLAASQESMELKGTIMVLGAYDHDVLGKDDFMGICVVLCNGIPQISNKSSLLDENSPKRMNLTLPLFHIEESGALQELALRHQFSDHEAIEFLNILSKSYHKQSHTPLLARLSFKRHH